MNRLRSMLPMVAALLSACTASKAPEPGNPPADAHGKPPAPNPAPSSWASRLGQTITIEGQAQNAKLGALVIGLSDDLWIDGMDAWRDDAVGKRVVVTGKLIEKDDLPVFVRQEGEPEQGGIPVPPGTDLQKARRRFLLTDVKWKLLE